MEVGKKWETGQNTFVLNALFRDWDAIVRDRLLTVSQSNLSINDRALVESYAVY